MHKILPRILVKAGESLEVPVAIRGQLDENNNVVILTDCCNIASCCLCGVFVIWFFIRWIGIGGITKAKSLLQRGA
jgi:hypothetical protein